MSTIDWSKAPEGYDFHFQGKAAPYGKFYKATSDRFVSEVDSYILYRDLAELFIVNHRPEQATQWAGEGLPPVGTVCELSERVLLADSDKSDWFEAGTKIEIGGHAIFNGATGPVCSVCVVGENFTGTLSEVCLRPIRTPEQIEADKRLHEIRNSLTTIKAGQQSFPNDIVRGNIVAATVEAMIDAGYRVQVMP